jgi:hypothetical protein
MRTKIRQAQRTAERDVKQELDKARRKLDADIRKVERKLR